MKSIQLFLPLFNNCAQKIDTSATKTLSIENIYEEIVLYCGLYNNSADGLFPGYYTGSSKW